MTKDKSKNHSYMNTSRDCFSNNLQYEMEILNKLDQEIENREVEKPV
jgi:hypothetical protein